MLRRYENGAGLEYQNAVVEWGQRQGVVGEGNSNMEPLNYQNLELALMAEVVVDSNPPMELGADYKNKLAYRPLAGGGMERRCVLRKCFAQKEGQHLMDSNPPPLGHRAGYKNKLAHRPLIEVGMGQRYVQQKCFVQKGEQHLVDSNPQLGPEHRNTLAH